MSTHVNDISGKKTRVGEKGKRKDESGRVSEKWRRRKESRGGCIYLMITFLLVTALETPTPGALAESQNHKQTKKRKKEKGRRAKGMKVDREQERGEL